MVKNKFILLLMVVFVLQPICVSAQMVTRTITDIDNGMAVPYATIYKSDSTFLCSASIDGVFSIEVTPGSFYKISHIGYKPITLTAEQLLSDEIIKMEMLPYELNPVVVTPNSALSDIYRAFDSTHKHIPSAPFFQRCYKKEQIISANDILLDSKAIIDTKVVKVHAVGKGVYIYVSIKGLQIDYNNIDSGDIIPNPRQISISNINQVSIPSKDAENIIFNRIHSENDSITIITFHPKFYGDAYKTGRFIIDKRTWIILRIDMTFDDATIEYQNRIAITSSNPKRLIHKFNRSVFFSTNGLPLKVEENIVYFLTTKPEEMYTWTLSQTYKDISKADYQQKPSRPYDPKKFIFQQKPITIPDFDARFNQGFQ